MYWNKLEWLQNCTLPLVAGNLTVTVLSITDMWLKWTVEPEIEAANISNAQSVVFYPTTHMLHSYRKFRRDTLYRYLRFSIIRPFKSTFIPKRKHGGLIRLSRSLSTFVLRSPLPPQIKCLTSWKVFGKTWQKRCVIIGRMDAVVLKFLQSATIAWRICERVRQNLRILERSKLIDLARYTYLLRRYF